MKDVKADGVEAKECLFLSKLWMFIRGNLGSGIRRAVNFQRRSLYPSVFTECSVWTPETHWKFCLRGKSFNPVRNLNPVGAVRRPVIVIGRDKRRQPMYVKRKIGARSCNRCCSGKAMSITQPVCICSLRQPGCNAHAPYCRLLSTQLYNVFPHYLINGTIFRKKLLNIKCVFWFPLQLFSETFLILRTTERDVIEYVYRSSCKVPFNLVQF